VTSLRTLHLDIVFPGAHGIHPRRFAAPNILESERSHSAASCVTRKRDCGRRGWHRACAEMGSELGGDSDPCGHLAGLEVLIQRFVAVLDARQERDHARYTELGVRRHQLVQRFAPVALLVLAPQVY
jgi:hypothetical protein